MVSYPEKRIPHHNQFTGKVEGEHVEPEHFFCDICRQEVAPEELNRDWMKTSWGVCHECAKSQRAFCDLIKDEADRVMSQTQKPTQDEIKAVSFHCWASAMTIAINLQKLAWKFLPDEEYIDFYRKLAVMIAYFKVHNHVVGENDSK